MTKARIAVLIIIAACLFGCKTTLKLAVPGVFKQQATMQHVKGARTNKMSFDNIKTTRIRRGLHVTYPGIGRPHILQNLLLNRVGIDKSEAIKNEKAKFRYNITDGKNSVQVYADEKEFTKELTYQFTPIKGLASFNEVMQYKYIFSAMIGNGQQRDGNNWELLLSNIYDRKAENDRNPFTVIKQTDSGLATNGHDTIYIRPLNIQKTETVNGRNAYLPLKLLSGYELNTADGVIAIIDLINRNVWLYNEMEEDQRLIVSAITTAILARRVHDVKW